MLSDEDIDLKVEVMGYAAGKQTYCFHSSCLTKLSFELRLLRYVPVNRHIIYYFIRGIANG
jgi:hypothetical protein